MLVTLLAKEGSGGGGATASGAGGLRPAEFRLHGAVRLRDLGVEVRVPSSWSATRRHSAITLRSGDRTTALAISAESPAGRQSKILESELAGIRHGYEAVSVATGFGKEIGGLPARGAVVSARTRSGTPLRILLATGSGDRHTYLVEVFSATNAPPERLIQAQLALGTLKLGR